MHYQNVKISIDQGITCVKDYTCVKGNDTSTIHIGKEESNDLSYKVSVLYRGIRENQPAWKVEINDKCLFMNSDDLVYIGSKSFVFRAVNKETIEIQETDEDDTVSLWVDLSGKRYEVGENIPSISEKIQALIEKGKIFKPSDDKEVKKILYHSNGVFLYASDKDGHGGDIYHAKETEEFVKCESKMKWWARCNCLDSGWEVTLSNETVKHKLEFPSGDVFCEGHEHHVLWDETSLKMITVDSSIKKT
jgi:hypothetical protein